MRSGVGEFAACCAAQCSNSIVKPFADVAVRRGRGPAASTSPAPESVPAASAGAASTWPLATWPSLRCAAAAAWLCRSADAAPSSSRRRCGGCLACADSAPRSGSPFERPPFAGGCDASGRAARRSAVAVASRKSGTTPSSSFWARRAAAAAPALARGFLGPRIAVISAARALDCRAARPKRADAAPYRISRAARAARSGVETWTAASANAATTTAASKTFAG
ncbi:hypothetical protein M885DRAFT_527295 [Pelagophyceae sp. CCMP2097]|nr:hypothetical protein M885DRAFT_527295 [Pelagophyceae sp. CCMP2097]